MREHCCEQCGGVYQNPQRDGTLYVHVCPPPRAPAPVKPGRWTRVRERLFGRREPAKES